MDINTNTLTPPNTLTSNNSLDGLQDIFDKLNIHEEQEPEPNLFLESYQNNEDNMAPSKDTMTKKTELNLPNPSLGKEPIYNVLYKKCLYF